MGQADIKEPRVVALPEAAASSHVSTEDSVHRSNESNSESITLNSTLPGAEIPHTPSNSTDRYIGLKNLGSNAYGARNTLAEYQLTMPPVGATQLYKFYFIPNRFEKSLSAIPYALQILPAG